MVAGSAAGAVPNVTQRTKMSEQKQRWMDILQRDGLSPQGLKTLEKIRGIADTIWNTTRQIVVDGGFQHPLFFFLRESGKIDVLPITAEAHMAIERVLSEAMKKESTVAVFHACEGKTIWPSASPEDEKVIDERYGGRVSLHPKARDVVLVHTDYVIQGKRETGTRMLLTDDSKKPRPILEEQNLPPGPGDSRGRFVGQLGLFKSIE